MGLIGCPETSVANYQSTLRYIREEQRSQCDWCRNTYPSALFTVSCLERICASPGVYATVFYVQYHITYGFAIYVHLVTQKCWFVCFKGEQI